MMTNQEPFDERERVDWLEVKRKRLADLAERYGADWIVEHQATLDEQWLYIADLEGFDPDTGK